MRDLTTGFKTGIAGRAVKIGLICFIDYPDTPIRTWSGTGSIEWDGQTWEGLGALGSMSAIQERTGTEAGNVTLTLAGVAPEMREVALANASAGRSVRLWIACFDADWNVVPDPWEPFAGSSDVHKIFNSTIEMTVETVLARLRQPRITRCTDADQQRRFPGDRGFEFSVQVNLQPVYWGVATPLGAGSSQPSNPGNGESDINN